MPFSYFRYIFCQLLTQGDDFAWYFLHAEGKTAEQRCFKPKKSLSCMMSYIGQKRNCYLSCVLYSHQRRCSSCERKSHTPRFLLHCSPPSTFYPFLFVLLLYITILSFSFCSSFVHNHFILFLFCSSLVHN